MPETVSLPKATDQQIAVVSCEIAPGESIKVDAGAGTGKTTLLLHFAKARPNDRLLYICFNTKAAQEAASKFAAAGIFNVTCSTVHGLARETKALYTAAGKFQTRIHLKDIRIELDCTQQFAWRVQNALNRFYQSADPEPNESHCSPRPKGDTTPPDDREILQVVRTGLLKQTRRIWEKTRNLDDKFPISFDGYLKVFQTEGHRLPYDYILLDEAQDSNPVTVAIVSAQASRCRIVLVGDAQQSIYAFRSAIDAMTHWKAKRTYPLNESFRFGANIAQCANLILQGFLTNNKTIVGLREKDSIGKIPQGVKYTLLARTNAKLIESALHFVANGKKVHFVGTTEDNLWDPTVPYKFNDVLDAWRLYANKRGEIRNPYFQNFENYQELVQLAKGQKAGENPEGIAIQGDKELEALCRMIDKHRENLPKIIESIIAHCTNPQEGAILLSTVHRAKGLEFKRVKLADDFTDLIVHDPEEDPETGGVTDGPPRLAIPDEDVDREEFHILYVAITRAIERLELCPQIEAVLGFPHLLPNPDLAKIEFDSTQRYLEEYLQSGGEKEDFPPPPPPSAGAEPELKIPFAEKDMAKELARGEGGKLLWNPTKKTWKWSHPTNKPIPGSLITYLPASARLALQKNP